MTRTYYKIEFQDLQDRWQSVQNYRSPWLEQIFFEKETAERFILQFEQSAIDLYKFRVVPY